MSQIQKENHRNPHQTGKIYFLEDVGLTIEEASEILECNPRKISECIERGYLKAVGDRVSRNSVIGLNNYLRERQCTIEVSKTNCLEQRYIDELKNQVINAMETVYDAKSSLHLHNLEGYSTVKGDRISHNNVTGLNNYLRDQQYEIESSKTNCFEQQYQSEDDSQITEVMNTAMEILSDARYNEYLYYLGCVSDLKFWLYFKKNGLKRVRKRQIPKI